MIKTTSGILAVIEQDRLIRARGVPYATARRFQKPTPVSTPAESRDATARGPAAPQDPSRLDKVNGPLVHGLDQDEDCLVLSVVAPADARNLPVMVWFHGGAYVSGGGEAPKYDPESLARKGVVVVNVTYRLGVFGYLTPPGAGNDNLGLLDQLTPLRWVRENIAAFGGDPDTVTIFGQSAGGDSVLSLAATPAARGLFRRAIAQSAPVGVRLGRSSLVQQRGPMTDAMRTAFAQHLQTEPLTASTEDLLKAQRAAIAASQRFGLTAGLSFAPIAGVDPLPPSLEETWRETASEVELLIGHTRDDAAPFVAMSPQMDRLSGSVQKIAKRAATRIVTKKLFDPKPIAELWREAGGRAATYRFDWQPQGGGPFGATHCIELPFLFDGDWSDAPMLDGQPIPAGLRDEVQTIWTDFARSGIGALHSNDLRIR